MKKFKFIFGLLMSALVLTASVTAASAASLPGRDMIISTQDGYFHGRRIDSTTYVPLYHFADTFGGCIYGWSFSEGVAYARADGLYLTADPGDLYIMANDRCFYTGQPVLDLNGTVYVPIEPMAKAFGVTVDPVDAGETNLWGSGRSYCAHASRVYSSDEVYWLSRIINAEAGCEPFLGKIAVGNVVMNRVAHPSYPNSIYGVIFDRKYGVQFTPAANGTIYKTPNADSVRAAKICLEGYSLSDDMLFFLNPRIASSLWIVRSRTPVMTVGRHDFYS